MANLQSYKEYHPVANDYVDALPIGWQLLPNIAIFQERKERGTENEEVLSISAIKGIVKSSDYENRKDRTSDDKSQYLLVKEGDLAYNTMLMWDGAVGHSSFRGIVSPAYTVLKSKMKINPKFFHYQMRTEFYKNYSRRYSYGIVDARLRLYYVNFKRMYSIVPPLEVQNNIVTYLDKKNNEIDKFIRNKEKLIELLEEQKQAEIDKSISYGINDNVELIFGRKEIPNFPSHWQLKRTKHLFSILNGYAFSTDLFISEGIQVLKISSLYQNELSLDRQPTFVDKKYLNKLKQFVVKKGDILVSLTGTLGKKDYGYAVQLKTDDLYLLNQRVAKLISKPIIDSHFALYLLRSEIFLNQLYMCPSGTKQANLSNDDILSIHIAIPPKEEQNQIVNYLDHALAKVDIAISKARQEIASIKEYREALITELVTGKRRVPSSYQTNEETNLMAAERGIEFNGRPQKGAATDKRIEYDLTI